ncbi:MAG: response regulator [Burkholderiaceae bacterium]
MTNTAHRVQSTQAILVASNNSSDAALVKGLLTPSFENVFTSTDADKIGVDFDRWQPRVLVLAFDELIDAQHYRTELSRHRVDDLSCPCRTVILCDKDDMLKVADLCIERAFDDYVLFWPMNHDAQRLPVAVHQALRELTASEERRPSVADFAAQARRISDLEVLLEQQMTEGQRCLTAEPVVPVIMVVDDDPFQHQLVARLLETQSCRLVFAGSGAEALLAIGASRPDLVLMDVQMPGMNGVEATRQLKTMPGNADLPVIMITGQSEGTVVVDSLSAGAADFLVKPFDPAKLIAKVKRWSRPPTAAGADTH